MKEERRLVWRVLRHWREIADGGHLPRRDEIYPWLQGEDGANCLLIAVEWSIELSHFVVVGVNLAVALCSTDDVEPGKRVAIVRVSRGLSVHSLWHHNRNTYYIRVATQTREPTSEELSRLFQRRGGFRAELRPVSGATLADLDRRRLRDYFSRVRQQEAPISDNDWTTLLVNTEIMVEEGVTAAGVLLFGSNPNRFLPQAGIDAPAFPGREKDYAARERSTMRGPITRCAERTV